MSSTYISELLACEGDFLVDIDSKISEIMQETRTLRNDVKTIINEESINFKPLIKDHEKLDEKATNLINDMKALQNDVNLVIKPELSSCSNDLKTLSQSLQEVNMSLYILNQLIEIHTLIKNANSKRESKKFFESAKLITTIQELIKNNANELKNLEMFKALSSEAIIAYEHLLHQITELWSQYFEFHEESKNDLRVISFSVEINSTSEIVDILSALDCLNYMLIDKKFISTFLSNVVSKIIMEKLTVKTIVNDKAILALEITNSSEKPHYSEVLCNLTEAVEFVKKYLDFEIGNGTNSFLSKIGTSIGNELAENLIKNCLSDTIPTNSEDLEKYNDVIKQIEEFEVKLKDCRLLPEKTTCLIDYAKNVNILFANKFCQSYLEKARLLMKKDLHNITSTDEIIISKITVLPKGHRNILRNKLNIQEEDGYIFPKCQISKSAEELSDLVNFMMNEILRSQDLCAVRLFYTIRNIFEMYTAVVPLHHKKFLDTLPQQVAIFHNNCMYFTNFLLCLTCNYYKKIPAILTDHFNIFLEEAVLLRTLAAEKLELHVTSQKNQLVYILRDSGLATLNEDPRLDPNAEKSIRQCIRQLQILQSVWKDVLPLKVYNRAIGFLLDSVIDELILLVMVVEDISSQTATDLAAMFTIVVERTPSLFSEPKEIFRHVKKWQKFAEFILVLKGSLKDIDDRWSNGMGPLANEFAAEEVKHLIRALFQNSDRRSALLNRIK